MMKWIDIGPGGKFLRAALLLDRLCGGYLFYGGGEKLEVARKFARATNCLSVVDVEDCGYCEVCKRIDDGRFDDLIEIKPQTTRNYISIEQIRYLHYVLPYGPFEGRRRIIIINPAERLRLEAANALLKMLEEPRYDTTFILITDNQYALLPTITSRLQWVRFTYKDYNKYSQINGAKIINDLRLLQSSPTSISKIAYEAVLNYKDRYEEYIDEWISFLHTKLRQGIDKAKEGLVEAIESVIEAKIKIIYNANPYLTISLMLLEIVKNLGSLENLDICNTTKGIADTKVSQTPQKNFKVFGKGF